MKYKFILISIAISSLTACMPNYSQGSRVGVVTKLSYKGIIFKSWEGSINQGGTKTITDGDGNSQVVPNAINFSAQNPKVVEKLNAAYKSGKRVEIVYTQYLIRPVTQESSYVVVDVKNAE